MSERNKTLTRRFYDEVLGKKNLDVIDEICVATVVDHSPLPGQAPGLQGLKQTIGAYLHAFPDLSIQVEEMIAEGGVVAVRLTGRGTHKGPFMGTGPTGKSVTLRGIDIIHIKDGKATEIWHEGNDAEVFMQLGIQLPVPG
jgi:predicted ester cyclase